MRRVKFKVVLVNSMGRRMSAFSGGKYNLEYPKGAIVRAVEGTLGVFVFKTRKQAEDFQSEPPYKIIHVRPVGRGKNVAHVCSSQSESVLDYFYNKSIVARSMTTPPGTMSYPAVEVLD